MINEEQKKQIVDAIPFVAWCEICYFHKPGNYTRQDCVTYEKRLCKLQEVTIERIAKILGVE